MGRVSSQEGSVSSANTEQPSTWHQDERKGPRGHLRNVQFQTGTAQRKGVSMSNCLHQVGLGCVCGDCQLSLLMQEGPASQLWAIPSPGQVVLDCIRKLTMPESMSKPEKQLGSR